MEYPEKGQIDMLKSQFRRDIHDATSLWLTEALPMVTTTIYLIYGNG
jgi:hypothetical protein